VWPTAKAEREVSESIAIPIVVVMASHPAVVELAASRASEGAGLASRDAAAFDPPGPESALPTPANYGGAVAAEMSTNCSAADVSTAESTAHAAASADMSAT
jgi:hypothetical protein